VVKFKLGVVDGTGDWSDADYAAQMEHSFCRQIFDAVGEPAAKYLRGPSMDGLSVRTKAYEIADWVSDARPDRVYLAGYSRGASAVIYAAELLQERGITVDVMFLFDAVARHVWSTLGGTTVPSNVMLTLHAARDQNAAMVRQYEGTINGGLGNPIRIWFGNTALKGLGPRFHYRTFSGSHGALGGVGWKHVKEDPACQQAVAAFMTPELQRALGVQIRSYPPTNEGSTGRTAAYVGALDRFAMDPKTPLKAVYDAAKTKLR